jgi:hypothetical protein
MLRLLVGRFAIPVFALRETGVYVGFDHISFVAVSLLGILLLGLLSLTLKLRYRRFARVLPHVGLYGFPVCRNSVPCLLCWLVC